MKILTHNNEEVELQEIEELKCDPISDTDKLKEATLKLQGAKLMYMEPIVNGLGEKEIKGLIMYFKLSNGEQKAIECYPGDCEPDELYVSLYQ